MLIKAKLSAVGETTAKEYALRFVLGGLATALASVASRIWGPVTGGLFLAFPAIFPASATIIETHQRERKEKAGGRGERRARMAVVAEATGAAIGCSGLAAFAVAAWLLFDWIPPAAAVAAATASWLAVSATAWWLIRRL